LAIDGKVVAETRVGYSRVRRQKEVGSSDANAPVRIGARKSYKDLDHPYKGLIDNVRIYNRALSAEEVEALYNMEKPVPKQDVQNAVRWNGHWYAIIKEYKNCEEAREHCKKLGGHLLIIETEEENKFINDWSVKNSLERSHLGARKRQTTGSQIEWIWDNEKSLSETYSNFGPLYQPSNPKLTSILIFFRADKSGQKSGQWLGNQPRHENYYICEWE
jgi:hypothetical protein